MQTQIKLRKIVNEKDATDSVDFLAMLAGVLDSMSRAIPIGSRIHEIQVKKLDGNTIDRCAEDCGVDPYNRSKLSHARNCRRGEPNTERRFLVLASVSTGDEAGVQDDDDDDDM